MDAKIAEQLLPIVEKAKEGILAGVEFAQEQMPDLINQLLAWNFVTSLLGWLFKIAILSCGILLIKQGIKEGRDCKWDDCDLFMPWFCGGGLITLLMLGALSVVPLVWLQIWVAPKLFLIEYLSNLIK